MFSLSSLESGLWGLSERTAIVGWKISSYLSVYNWLDDLDQVLPLLFDVRAPRLQAVQEVEPWVQNRQSSGFFESSQRVTFVLGPPGLLTVFHSVQAIDSVEECIHEAECTPDIVALPCY